ncbi:hypothetical protein [Streptomyces sp. NPDC086023]|uniref:hypothetical protein n=1 Tax=Streptomyces sp. NPDC086023 TaxID=3365746 RepID=UPI0037D1BE2B
MRLTRRSALAAPAAVALAVGAWGLHRGTLWRDEAVTWQVARRTLPEIWHLAGSVDAVHALYYALVHALFALDPHPGEVVLRLPSLLGAAATAALVAELGVRLARPRVGLWAGLAYAVTPLVSRYAQEGRSYALVGALVALATVLFTARRWVGYAAVLAAAGLLHVFALLVLPAHLLSLRLGAVPRTDRRRWALAAGSACAAVGPLLWWSRGQSGQVGWLERPDAAAAGQLALSFAGPSPVVAGTALALAAAGLLAAPRVAAVAAPLLLVPPALLLAVSQLEPLYYDRYVLFALPGLPLLAAAGLDALPAAPAALSRWRAGRTRGASPAPGAERAARPKRREAAAAGGPGTAWPEHREAAAAGGPGAAPGGRGPVRGAGRAVRSEHRERTAAGGSGAVRGGRRQACGPAPVAYGLAGVLLVAAGFWAQYPVQARLRTPESRGDDFAAVARSARALVRPGDAVLYVPDMGRRIALAYPDSFRAAADVGLAVPGPRSATLYGTETDAATLRRRLARHDRVWLVLTNEAAKDPDWPSVTPAEHAKRTLLRTEFAETGRRRLVHGRVVLVRYERLPRPAAAPP